MYLFIFSFSSFPLSQGQNLKGIQFDDDNLEDEIKKRVGNIITNMNDKRDLLLRNIGPMASRSVWWCLNKFSPKLVDNLSSEKSL